MRGASTRQADGATSKGAGRCPVFTHNFDAVFIELDVHKDSISVGILNPGHDSADVERILNDPASMGRLIGRFDDPVRLRVCYEAGSTGFYLARDLRRMGVSAR